MSRKDVGDDLCHLEPLPRFDFRPVIANGSFTSTPAVARSAQGVEKGQFVRRVAAQNNRATETRSPIGQARRQAALFCRRSRLARTRITLSAKNGVCLTMKRNCCS
jgi:hypothetical protein